MKAMQKPTAQLQQESQKTRARPVHPCVVLKTLLQKKTCLRLMSLAQDNGTFIKSRHQQYVICIQTSKRTSFEQLFHLDRDYLTLVRTANSPRLLYLAASWLVAKWFLGSVLVGGEMVSWWRVGWWRNFLVAR